MCFSKGHFNGEAPRYTATIDQTNKILILDAVSCACCGWKQHYEIPFDDVKSTRKVFGLVAVVTHSDRTPLGAAFVITEPGTCGWCGPSSEISEELMVTTIFAVIVRLYETIGNHSV